MITTGSQLPLSLNVCRRLEGAWEQTACKGGVFMENFITSYGGQSPYVRDDDPCTPATGSPRGTSTRATSRRRHAFSALSAPTGRRWQRRARRRSPSGSPPALARLARTRRFKGSASPRASSRPAPTRGRMAANGSASGTRRWTSPARTREGKRPRCFAGRPSGPTGQLLRGDRAHAPPPTQHQSRPARRMPLAHRKPTVRGAVHRRVDETGGDTRTHALRTTGPRTTHIEVSRVLAVHHDAAGLRTPARAWLVNEQGAPHGAPCAIPTNLLLLATPSPTPVEAAAAEAEAEAEAAEAEEAAEAAASHT